MCWTFTPGPNPSPLGGEGSGVVSQVGSEVTRFQAGDEVFGIMPHSMATYCPTLEDYIAIKPANVPHEGAASVPVTCMTAHYGMVRLGYLKNGARVLVHAASGSVGVAAVQIAKKYGCEIFGTADLALQFLKDMGVHHVLHSRNNSFKG
jgi:polyketide synthase 12